MTLDLGADALASPGTRTSCSSRPRPRAAARRRSCRCSSRAARRAATLDIPARPPPTRLPSARAAIPTRAAILYVNETGDLLALRAGYHERPCRPARLARHDRRNLSSFVVMPDGSIGLRDRQRRREGESDHSCAAALDRGLAASLPRPRSPAVAGLLGERRQVAPRCRQPRPARRSTSSISARATLARPRSRSTIRRSSSTVAPADLVQVIEEDGSAAYLQAVDAAPLAERPAGRRSAHRA